MGSIDELPIWQGEDTCPPAKMEEIFNGFISRPEACTMGIYVYPKLVPWCEWVAKRQREMPKIDYIPEKFLPDASFDQIFTDLPQYAYTFHILFLIMSILVLIGIIGNILCLPWFNSKLNKSGATLYMTFAAIFDICYLIGFILVYTYQLSAPDITTQFNRYTNWSIYLVPKFVPCFQTFNLISLWLIIALLIDRLPIAAETISPQAESLLDPKIKEAIHKGRSRCRYTIYLMIMIFFFSLYTVIKSFGYLISYDYQYDLPIVANFLMDRNAYKISMVNVLTPIVEIFLPGLLIIWYLILIRDKKYGFKKFQLHKRQMETEENQNFNDQHSGISNYDIVCDDCTTARTSAMMNLSIIDCKRWKNEFIVTKLTINVAFFYLLNMVFQTIAYYIRHDNESTRDTKEILNYFSVIMNTMVISLKPFVYLFSSKVVIKELHKLQRNSPLYSVHRNNVSGAWRKHWTKEQRAQDSHNILA